MAEMIRPKKPKNRVRPENEEAPAIPDRPLVVNGMRLPAVPSHIPEQQEERTSSPEPEEQLLSDTEDVEEEDIENTKPTPTVLKDSSARNSPVRPAPPPPRISQEREAPPLPPRSTMFPRSVSMVSESTNQPSAQVAPKRSVAVAPYPTVPELAELPSYTAALRHPQIYPAINDHRQLQHSHSATTFPNTNTAPA
uniref:Uncharacterized protein n=1 Tax=Caenorhabditis japonica TaxID=281687 RepID=A0A8R1IEI8_CAEJA